MFFAILYTNQRLYDIPKQIVTLEFLIFLVIKRTSKFQLVFFAIGISLKILQLSGELKQIKHIRFSAKRDRI